MLITLWIVISLVKNIWESLIKMLRKGTLTQIWKSPYMFVFIEQPYPENLLFLIQIILELYTRKVCKIFVYKHTETIEYVKN